MNIIQQSSWF